MCEGDIHYTVEPDDKPDPGTRITITEYLESSDTLYYFAERGTGTQHKVLFAHKGLPVIDASWGGMTCSRKEELGASGRSAQCKPRIERRTIVTGHGTLIKQIPEFGDRWLRVVVNVTVYPNKRVTAFFDRRLRKTR